MSKQRALILMASPRKNGNTSWLACQIGTGLKARGIDVTLTNATLLRSVNNGCIGCFGCQRSELYECVFKDDVQPVVTSMPAFDYVIFATPVYFYGGTAQLKLVVDRMFSLLKKDPDGNHIHPFRPGTKFGFVMTCGDGEEEGAGALKEKLRRIAALFDRPFETLVFPFSPLLPNQIENPDEWTRNADNFCTALLG